MPRHLQKILYTAEAVLEGGREGYARSLDGRLVVDLSVPKAMDGSAEPGTSPEQLFAVGYAACFQSALFSDANSRKLDASESQIICRVGFGPNGHGGFGLTVALDLHAPFLTREQGADLMARAHERCPYSNATPGNIDIELSVDGVPLAALADATRSRPPAGAATTRSTESRVQPCTQAAAPACASSWPTPPTPAA